jgi:hypothetical protein
MRHSGETKSAIAIGIDGRRSGVMGRQGLTASAFALADVVSRVVPSRISTGEAMKIEE